jgi:hypothetical protein
MLHSSGEGFRTYVAIFLAPGCVFALMSGVSLSNDGILFLYLLFFFPNWLFFILFYLVKFNQQVGIKKIDSCRWFPQVKLDGFYLTNN